MIKGRMVNRVYRLIALLLNPINKSINPSNPAKMKEYPVIIPYKPVLGMKKEIKRVIKPAINKALLV
jgi:hypothetical protein